MVENTPRTIICVKKLRKSAITANDSKTPQKMKNNNLGIDRNFDRSCSKRSISATWLSVPNMEDKRMSQSDICKSWLDDGVKKINKSIDRCLSFMTFYTKSLELSDHCSRQQWKPPVDSQRSNIDHAIDSSKKHRVRRPDRTPPPSPVFIQCCSHCS